MVESLKVAGGVIHVNLRLCLLTQGLHIDALDFLGGRGKVLTGSQLYYCKLMLLIASCHDVLSITSGDCIFCRLRVCSLSVGVRVISGIQFCFCTSVLAMIAQQQETHVQTQVRVMLHTMCKTSLCFELHLLQTSQLPIELPLLNEAVVVTAVKERFLTLQVPRQNMMLGFYDLG